jgi:hypothetical protein
MDNQVAQVVAQTPCTSDAETGFLGAYLSEREYARQRGISLRTAQRERKSGIAPPYVVLGKRKFHRLAGLRQWLLEREQCASGISIPSRGVAR